MSSTRVVSTLLGASEVSNGSRLSASVAISSVRCVRSSF